MFDGVAGSRRAVTDDRTSYPSSERSSWSAPAITGSSSTMRMRAMAG